MWSVAFCPGGAQPAARPNERQARIPDLHNDKALDSTASDGSRGGGWVREPTVTEEIANNS